jgi:hypothetical protein
MNPASIINNMNANAILAIIRGEMPLSVLPELGIEITCHEGNFKLRSSPSSVIVKPSISDIARGILAHQLNRSDLRAWAFFVLGEADIDLEKIESDPQGEMLVEALWEASSTGEIRQEVLRIADNLA